MRRSTRFGLAVALLCAALVLPLTAGSPEGAGTTPGLCSAAEAGTLAPRSHKPTGTTDPFTGDCDGAPSDCNARVTY